MINNICEYMPGMAATLSVADVRAINPLVLAFVGDSVETLFVRTYLSCTSSAKAGELHKAAAAKINAKSQACDLDAVFEKLTDEEKDIYKRARNSRANTVPKNANLGEYKKASGYEAVIGYLYLTGNTKRLNEILLFAVEGG